MLTVRWRLLLGKTGEDSNRLGEGDDELETPERITVGRLRTWTFEETADERAPIKRMNRSFMDRRLLLLGLVGAGW